jgi:hypothetical protein
MQHFRYRRKRFARLLLIRIELDRRMYMTSNKNDSHSLLPSWMTGRVVNNFDLSTSTGPKSRSDQTQEVIGKPIPFDDCHRPTQRAIVDVWRDPPRDLLHVR